MANNFIQSVKLSFRCPSVKKIELPFRNCKCPVFRQTVESNRDFPQLNSNVPLHCLQVSRDFATLILYSVYKRH